MKITDDKRNYIGKDLESMAEAKNYYNWMIEQFGKYIGKNVLEVGAGNGTFTRYIMKAKPNQITCIEPSHEMYPLLEENLKGENDIKVLNGFLSNFAQELKESFDSVFYINVMEHVEKDIEEIALVNKVLKRGGHVCIYVPALNWLMGTFDEQVGHYRRYDRKMLKDRLKLNGFEIVDIRYSDIYGILPWFLAFKVLKKRDLGASQVSLYDRFLIPFIRLQEKLLAPPIGKNVWVVARKI